MTMPFISLILLSGGKGVRMGSATPKQYLPFLGKKLAWHSLEFFLNRKEISEIIVVAEKEYQPLFLEKSPKLIFAKPGPKRQDSVFSGFQKTAFHSELIIIHDIVRPFIAEKAFLELIAMALKYGAATLGSKVKHTIKEVKNGFVEKTLNREKLYEIYTPQAIVPDFLKKGFGMLETNQTVTDDTALVELLNMPVKIVEDGNFNPKITTKIDLKIAESYAQIQT